MNIVDSLSRYEDGELDETEQISLFQELVDTGLAWQLQGSYGRTAAQMLTAGLVTHPAFTRQEQIGGVTYDVLE